MRYILGRILYDIGIVDDKVIELGRRAGEERMINVYWQNTSGRPTVSIGERLSIHLFPKGEDIMCGLIEDWYDGRHFLFGLWRFALITWW